MITVVFHSPNMYVLDRARNVLDFEILVAWRMGLVQETIHVRRHPHPLLSRYLVRTAYLAFVLEIKS